MDQQKGSNLVKLGIDLKEFYMSVEWDILAVPAERNQEYFPGVEEPYPGQARLKLLLIFSSKWQSHFYKFKNWMNKEH